MSFIIGFAFLKALGWALVNSLWQFGCCFLLYRLLTPATRQLPAAVRHTIALCLLFSGTLFFILECSWKYYTGGPVSNLLSVENTGWYNSWQTAGVFLDRMMPYWSIFYLACIGMLFLKLYFFMRRAGGLQQNGISKLSGYWRMYIKNISAQLGIQQEVKAFLSIQIDTPQIIGFFKPVILIPAACLANLSTEQMEAVLLHELVHIKRNDCLVNLLVAAVEILFFFNPFVKQLAACIRKEREYSCDDMVIQFKYHPGNYASALLTLEKNRLTPVMYGIATSGNNQRQLLTRVERIVGITSCRQDAYKAGAAFTALLLFCLMAAIHPSPAVDMLQPGSFGLAGNSIIGLPYSTEGVKTIRHAQLPVENNTVKAVATLPATVPVKASAGTTHEHSSCTEQPADDGITTANVAILPADDTEDDNIITATSKETRDFALRPTEPTDAPESPAAEEEPYVPASSFLFQLAEDTAHAKTKGTTFHEHQANAAMIKAQKALALINWRKIEKELRYQPKTLVKLKRELTLQLSQLDWQKINANAQSELQQKQLESLKEVINQNQELKEYQQAELYYESLKKQMMEQQQTLKISQQRMENAQMAAEDQQKKLLQEMKKRKIIYL